MMEKTKYLTIAVLVAMASGCGAGDGGLGDGWFDDWDLFDGQSIAGLEDRYAVGTVDVVSAGWENDGFTRITSSDPSVVEVVALGDEEFELRMHAAGTVDLTVRDSDGESVETIEVATATRVEFKIAETGPFVVTPTVQADGATVVAGKTQWLAIEHFDARGPLYGSDGVSVTWPSKITPCEPHGNTYLDLRCFVTDDAGSHEVVVDAFGEVSQLQIDTVLAQDVVELVVAAPDESELVAGETVRLEAYGLTADGVRVDGLGAAFSDPNWLGTGHLGYTYDPRAPFVSVTIIALDLSTTVRIRGEFTVVENAYDLECSATPWGNRVPSGPLAVFALIVSAAIVRRRVAS